MHGNEATELDLTALRIDLDLAICAHMEACGPIS
jgi:hypothetical protein